MSTDSILVICLTLLALAFCGEPALLDSAAAAIGGVQCKP